MARPRRDLTGQPFGRWVVERMDWATNPTRAYVRCTCGTARWIVAHNLTTKHARAQSRSCGCLRREQATARLRAIWQTKR